MEGTILEFRRLAITFIGMIRACSRSFRLFGLRSVPAWPSGCMTGAKHIRRFASPEGSKQPRFPYSFSTIFLSKFARTQPFHLAEETSEIGRIFKAELVGDLRNVQVGMRKKTFRFENQSSLQMIG